MTPPPVPRRRDMTRSLAGPLPTSAAVAGLRPVDAQRDVPALAALLRLAYRGTVDDEGETAEQALHEMQRTLDGAYGPWLPQGSSVVERAGVLVSASLLTHWRGQPLLAYAMTDPRWQRQGLARAGLCHALAAQQAAGEQRLSLVVTLANVPALRLYESLGFVPGR